MKQWLLKHRRRIATLVMLVGIGVVGGQLANAYPREVSLRMDLGPAHLLLEEADLRFVGESGEVAGLRLNAPVPQEVRHRLELAPGRYEVQARLQGELGEQQLRRGFYVPAEGPISLRLYEDALARLP